MSFWSTGLGKTIRGAANKLTGGLSEVAVDLVTGGNKKKKNKSKTGEGMNGGTLPEVRTSGPSGGAINVKQGSALSNIIEGRAKKQRMAREHEIKQNRNLFEKGFDWAKENPKTVSAGAGVLFFLIRTWQMGLSKSKRWAIFK